MEKYKYVDFENTFSGEEDANEFTTIDGWPAEDYDEDGNEIPGSVIANVWITPNNDVVVDWHHPEYKTNPVVLELIDETINDMLSERGLKERSLPEGECVSIPVPEHDNKYLTPPGECCVNVWKTPHNDIVIDWHDNGLRSNDKVLSQIKETVSSMVTAPSKKHDASEIEK